jgi:hypothetical protein
MVEIQVADQPKGFGYRLGITAGQLVGKEHSNMQCHPMALSITVQQSLSADWADSPDCIR